MPSTITLEDETELAEIVRSAHTVAVVGLRDADAGQVPAHEIPKLLQTLGLDIVPVNPKLTQALGVPAYPDLAAMAAANGRVDVVDVFRRAEAVPGIADEILALPVEQRPTVFWMQTGIHHDDAAARLAAAGIRVVQDRCLCVYAQRYRRPVTGS